MSLEKRCNVCYINSTVHQCVEDADIFAIDFISEAIRDKDEATRRKLEIVKGKLEARIARLEKDRERLVLEFAAERKQLAKESEAARQREHDEHITLLRTQFERSASTQAAATERADLLNQISELQRQFAISQGFFTQLGRSVDRIFK